jgi:hypothetical protein
MADKGDREPKSPLLQHVLSKTGLVAELPGDVQIRIDIHVCLLDAMADQFGISRSDIGSDTVPSEDPIAATAVGWGTCLARFERYLQELRPLYGAYDHQERYTEATLDLEFSAIKTYLYEALIEQLDEVLG